MDFRQELILVIYKEKLSRHLTRLSAEELFELWKVTVDAVDKMLKDGY